MEPEGTNTQNDNFFTLNKISILFFFRWNSYLEYGYRFGVAFTVAEIWEDQQFYFNVKDIEPYVKWINDLFWKSRLDWTWIVWMTRFKGKNLSFPNIEPLKFQELDSDLRWPYMRHLWKILPVLNHCNLMFCRMSLNLLCCK